MIRFRFPCLVLAGLLLSAGLLGCATDADAPDRVFVNGKVVTVDEATPEVEAVAVKEGRVLAVGTTAEIREMAGSSTEVVDLEGRLMIPGFIEGHGHFMGFGQSQMILDLTQAETWDEMVALVAEAAEQAEPGAWITGRGWHQEKWTETPEGTVDGVPTHHSLSEVSSDNPVLLTHASGHAAFANALAMELGRVSPETQDPMGGEIVRDAAGNPTGLLRERAQGLVRRAYEDYRSQMTPEEREAEAREQVRLAGEAALRHGVTSFQDAGSGLETIAFLRRMADEGALPIRLYVMVRGEPLDTLDARMDDVRMVGYGDEFLTVRSLKLAIDGALGPHGAWLLEPYEDMPQSTGLALAEVADLKDFAEVAAQHDYQVNIHAIGDRANREVLDLYEELLNTYPEAADDHRWRIEHAQHLHPDDIPRFAELGVIPAMQAVHATSDGPWVVKRLGEQRAEEGAYVWRTLWDSGAVVTNGTDVPVEAISPIESYYATVSRRTGMGEAFYPDEALTRMEALQSYTLNNAYAAFEEDIKGSITPGKLADFVVLSNDILTVPEEEILDAEPVLTVVGGDVVYRASAP